MSAWGLRVLRALALMTQVIAWLFAAALAVAVFTAWYALHAPDMRVLRAVLARVHVAFAGQHITDLDLDVQLDPSGAGLRALASLRAQFEDPNKRVFYFLLDPGLQLVGIATGEVDAEQRPSRWLRLGPLVQAWREPGTSTQRFTVEYHGRPGLRPQDCVVDRSEVLLPPHCLWYPLDGQSFFSANVKAQIPAAWQLVEHGDAGEGAWRGRLRQYTWQSDRAVAGFALVAGAYQKRERWAGDTLLRAYAPANDAGHLDAVLDTMESAHAALVARLGPSGFPQSSLFLHPDLSRAFHDGAGVIGIPRRALASEDAGFALVAHELAHHWWGATVTGGWLRTGTGAQWIIEGFAEVSSLAATEAVWGRDASVKRLLSEFYDPQEQQELVEMTVLDNVLPAARGRDTIYRKGSYVAWMLRNLIGEEAFFQALRDLVQRHAQSEVTVQDVQAAFERAGGKSLDSFFHAFVRGRDTLDFAIQPAAPRTLAVENTGTAPWTAPVDVWVRNPRDGHERVLAVVPPAQVALEAEDSEVIVDPYLQWPDMVRENNRYPRREAPLWVAPSSASVLTVSGEPFPWSRTRARLRALADPAAVKDWEFLRGVLGPPRFDPEHDRFILSLSEPGGRPPQIVVLEAVGSRRVQGRGFAPVPADNGAVLAAVGDRIVRFGASGRLRTVLRLPGKTVDHLVPLGQPGELAFVASDDSTSTLFLAREADSSPKPVLQWERGISAVAWNAVDHSFVVGLANGPSWEIWQLSPSDAAPKVVVRDAALLSDLAVSPDGSKLAFVAAAERRYPRTQRLLFVVDLRARTVRSWAANDLDFVRLAWEGDDAVLAIARVVPPASPAMYPWDRTLCRVRLGSEQIERIAW